MSSPAPGWYPDPYQPEHRRYWDGARWTEMRASPQRIPPPPRGTLPLSVAVGGVLSIAIPLIFSRALLHRLGRYSWPIVAYLAIAAVLAYLPPVLFWLYASKRWGTGHRATDAGVHLRWSDLGWGPVTWLACIAAQLFMVAIIVNIGIPYVGNTQGISTGHDRRGYVIAIVVVAVVLAPLVEELLFRGLILRGLLSATSPPTAITLQAILFGLAHVAPERGLGNVGLVMILSAVGGVLGTAAYLLRRLGPTMLAHAIMNGVVLLIVLHGFA